MGEILGQGNAVLKDFRDEAFVLDREQLNLVAEALGVELSEIEPHKRLLEEIAFALGYGRRGLGVEVDDAMRSALEVYKERHVELGPCV